MRQRVRQQLAQRHRAQQLAQRRALAGHLGGVGLAVCGGGGHVIHERGSVSGAACSQLPKLALRRCSSVAAVARSSAEARQSAGRAAAARRSAARGGAHCSRAPRMYSSRSMLTCCQTNVPGVTDYDTTVVD